MRLVAGSFIVVAVAVGGCAVPDPTGSANRMRSGNATRAGNLVPAATATTAGPTSPTTKLGNPAPNKSPLVRLKQQAVSGRPLRVAVLPAGYDAAFWESYRDRLEKASGAYHLRVDWRARVMDEAARTKARTALHGQKFDCLLVGSLDGNGIEVIDNNDPARRQVTVVTSDASLACAQVAKRIKAITHGSGMVLVVAAGLTPATDLLIAEIRIASPALKVEIRGPAALDAVGSAAVIYAADAGSTQDVLRAVERRGRTGKVKVIGYGGGDALAASLEKGELDGLIMQKPVKMALQSIQAYSQFRLGEKVPPRISSNDLLITRDAIRTPRMRALLGLKPRPPVVGAAKSGGRNR